MHGHLPAHARRCSPPPHHVWSSSHLVPRNCITGIHHHGSRHPHFALTLSHYAPPRHAFARRLVVFAASSPRPPAATHSPGHNVFHGNVTPLDSPGIGFSHHRSPSRTKLYGPACTSSHRTWRPTPSLIQLPCAATRKTIEGRGRRAASLQSPVSRPRSLSVFRYDTCAPAMVLVAYRPAHACCSRRILSASPSSHPSTMSILLPAAPPPAAPHVSLTPFHHPLALFAFLVVHSFHHHGRVDICVSLCPDQNVRSSPASPSHPRLSSLASDRQRPYVIPYVRSPASLFPSSGLRTQSLVSVLVTSVVYGPVFFVQK